MGIYEGKRVRIADFDFHSIQLVFRPEHSSPREFLLQNAPGVAGIVCLLTDRIDAAVLEAAGSSFLALLPSSFFYILC